jgi:hypothetical protein
VQKLHGHPALEIGSSGARAKRMNVSKKNLESSRNSGVSGKASWIADELIGIRTLEERLSKKLNSKPAAANNRVLLDGIQDLKTRVELLDRALDELSRSRRAA